MKSYIRLFRVKQWIKNLFLVFPLVFSGNFFIRSLDLNCFLGFAAFCLISSGMYIVNDVMDLKEDRMHPVKSKRPLAAGDIPVAVAEVVAVVLLILGELLSWGIDREFFMLATAYILLQVLYNLRLKRAVIMDVLAIAFGFQIRIWAGSVAVHVLPSVWLQMCVLVLALFLGFTKRRYEMIFLKSEASDCRGVLSEYTPYLLDLLVTICATLAIVFYSLYTISSEIVVHTGGYAMFYSTGFVIYGILRYLYLLHIKRIGGDPGEVLLSDAPMIINILGWVIFIMVMIY